MKKFSVLVLSLLGMITYAQTDPYAGKVGINTEEPEATLQVVSKTGTTSSTKNTELRNAANVKLVTVLDNGFVGINQGTPVAPLHIVSPAAGYGNDIIIEDYANKVGDPSALIFNRNRGTYASPQVLQQDDIVGQVIFSTKNGVASSLASPRMAEIGSLFKGGNKGTLYFNTSEVQRMVIKDTGEVQVNNLSGTGDRPVYADANGVLKIGTASSSELKATDTTEQCTDANLGSIHFKEITEAGGNKKGVFGFCTKQNNVPIWVYLSNGGNIIYGTGTFGDGL